VGVELTSFAFEILPLLELLAWVGTDLELSAFARGDGRLLAFVIAAFKTCASVGLIPQARHGGKGVCTFAAVGSKLEGTGFEKLQIVHSQVAAVAAGGVEGGRKALSLDCDPESSRRIDVTLDEALSRRPRCLCGFGKMVILGEDFRKPP
jgi:hypothetical protein